MTEGETPTAGKPALGMLSTNSVKKMRKPLLGPWTAGGLTPPKRGSVGHLKTQKIVGVVGKRKVRAIILGSAVYRRTRLKRSRLRNEGEALPEKRERKSGDVNTFLSRRGDNLNGPVNSDWG